MANTFEDYTVSTSTTDFNITFEYLEDSHVVVEIDGVLQATSAYSIIAGSPNLVRLNSAATAGMKVRVRRDSNADSDNPFVDFVNGSVLTESELDKSYRHNLYLNEEIGNLNDRSLQKEVGGSNWDTKSLRLINVSDPVGAQDAATKNYVDTADALKVSKAGDTMSGALAMGANKITGVADPTLVQDAATKNYTDTQISNTVSGSSTESVKTTFTGAGSSAFTFGSGISLDGDTMYEVAIDGVLQEPTVAYAINADANTITFTSTPPTGSNIVVVQRGYAIPVTTGSVSTSQLDPGAVNNDKLADDSVTNDKILNGTITADKLDNTAKDRSIHTGTQTASTISDFDTEVSNNTSVAANTAKVGLTDNSVTAARISDTDTQFLVDDTSAQKAVVINEGGADVDFRVEGDNNANLISTDAANDVVGVNLTSLDVSTTFNTSDKYGLQVSKGLLISQDNDQARIQLKSIDATNGSCQIRLESAAHTGTNEGKYTIFTGGANGKFNITNERSSKTLVMDANGAWYPSSDYNAVSNDSQSCGLASNRWSVIYANASVITTSDRNEKEQIEDLSEAELRVATALKGLVKKFKFKNRTRTHVGVIAQDVQDAFTAEGLNAEDYGLFCSDTWTDDDGNSITRLGIRYEELLAFIIAAL